MAESQPEKTLHPPTSLAERVARYKEDIERVVREVGEHPDYEMKRSCSLQNLSDRLEFVKDIQSIATSHIEAEKYLIIGADEKNRSFCEVSNRSEFDEASIRQILDKYLSPVPMFQVFQLESSDGHHFVLFVLPKQPRRRILAKVTVTTDDPKDLMQRVLLRVGDLWTKGSSTGKRLAKVEDWDDIYQEIIEAEAEQKARIRTAHAIELAMAREKMRPTGHSLLPSVFTDDEFQALMEDVCYGKDGARLKVLLERLRDDVVEGWHRIGAYEELFADNPFADRIESFTEARQKVLDYIKNVLRPAMHWVALAGIYTVKNSGPVEFLDAVVDLLKEVFETTHSLRTPRAIVPQGQISQSIEDHVSHTVPALESLISLHLIGAYLTKRKRFEYLRSVFRANVFSTGWQGQHQTKRLLAFWPLDMGIGNGEPQILRKWGGRLKLCAGRVKTDLAYVRLFGSEKSTIDSLCQYEFCLELNSFLAIPKLSPESGSAITQLYPNINFAFHPDLIAFPLEPLHDLATELMAEIKYAKPKLLSLILFNSVLIVPMTKPGADKVFGSFLDSLTKGHGQLWLAEHHFPPESDWPLDLANELKRLREPKK